MYEELVGDGDRKTLNGVTSAWMCGHVAAASHTECICVMEGCDEREDGMHTVGEAGYE